MTDTKTHKDYIDTAQELYSSVQDEPDVVGQQMIVELLMVCHAGRAVNTIVSCKLIDGMAKHAKQILTENIYMIADGKHGGR